MRVEEYLLFRGRIKGVRGHRLLERVQAVLDACGLLDVRARTIGKLSKGYQKRVGLADSLVHEPELLILDEPTIGLDPNQIRQFRDLVRGLAQRHTVLLSTHIMQEVEAVCDRVLIINKGRIVVSETPDNLVGLMKGNVRVHAEIRGPWDAILEKIKAVPGVLRVVHTQNGDWNRYTCECQKGADIRPDLARLAADQKWDIRELTEEKRNLEDAFVAMIREAEALSREIESGLDAALIGQAGIAAGGNAPEGGARE